jgi:hypothetical protein
MSHSAGDSLNEVLPFGVVTGSSGVVAEQGNFGIFLLS